MGTHCARYIVLSRILWGVGELTVTITGYGACRVLTGPDFQSVFNLQLWASNAKLINYYMLYGYVCATLFLQMGDATLSIEHKAEHLGVLYLSLVFIHRTIMEHQ